MHYDLTTENYKLTPLQLKNNWIADFDDELFVQDPDEIERKTLRGDTSDVFALVKFTSDSFLSLSTDGAMIFWSYKGKKKQGFKNETCIKALKIVNSYQFLTINTENEVALWSLYQSEVEVVYDVSVDSFDALEIAAGFLSFISKEEGLKVYKDNGSHMVTFKDATEFFEGWKYFDNGYWLTSNYKKEIVLWKKDGTKVIVMPYAFQFKETYYIDSEKFVFNNKDGSIIIYSFEGKKISQHNDFAGELKDFIESYETLNKHKKDKDDILDFEHVNNPSRRNKYIPREVIAEQNISLKDESKKILWNFFNRPLFGPIQNLLAKHNKRVKKFRKNLHLSALSLTKSLEECCEQINKLTIRKKIYLILMLVMFVVTGAASFALLHKFALPFDINLLVGGAGLLSVILFFLWNGVRKSLNTEKVRQEKIESSLATIDVLMPEMEAFVTDLEKYKYSILQQIPIIQDKTLYSGTKIQEIIKSKINTTIKEMALNECGIDESEILYVDTEGNNKREAIILHDWSYVQDKSSDSMAEDITKHNELSFWSSQNGGMVFAVQFIQLVFLTKDKIDVFTTYYDFIKDEFISKKSYAYYYKDVTNISKQDVKRTIHTEDEDYSAEEIILQVSSGDAIRLTVINAKTMKNLQDIYKHKLDEDQLDQLQEEREEILEDDSLSPEDRKDRLAEIDGDIEQIKNSTIVITSDNSEMTKANKMIQNIRVQLRSHKVSDVATASQKSGEDEVL